MEKKKRRIRLQTKFTLATLILAIILCVGLAIMSYSSFKRSIERRYEEQITGIVKTAAALIDPATIRGYVEEAEEALAAGREPAGLSDPAYIHLHQQFQMITEKNGLEFLFSYVPDSGGFRNFVQGTKPGDQFHYDLGYYAAVNVDYPQENIDSALNMIANPGEYIDITDSKYGYLVTAFTVVPDENGEPYLIVGADLSMHEVNDTLQRYLLTVCLIAVAIVAVFIGIYLGYLRRGMIHPLQLLVDSAVRFVKTGVPGHEAAIKKMDVQVNTGDEIEDLANAFNKMSEDIVTYINDLTTVTAEKERIGAELNVATTIQASMLPSQFPPFPEHSEFDIYATMTPAKEVGGDFYDMFLIDEDHLGVVVADVSGKGVPAALFMVRSMTLIKTQAMTGQAPGEVLTAVNEELCSNNEGDLFVTVWFGILELSTGKLVFANAGHEQPIIRHDGQCQYLSQRPGFVLGGLSGMMFQDQELTLMPGDALFQYSDGVTESTDIHNELFGDDRLLVAANRFSDLPPEQFLPRIKAEIDEFVGTAPQFDDITMLGLVYKG